MAKKKKTMNEMNEMNEKSFGNGLSVFDPRSFDQMGQIARQLASSSLVPDTLKGNTDDQTVSNCFRVVEQAQRWGLSPFAVMDSASVVRGKLMWEGKLIAAAIKSGLGIRLKYEYSGEGEKRKIIVSAVVDGALESIEGTVSTWKTTHDGSPWKAANYDQMLAYRGARQWARRYAPEVILGVYAPDEMDSKWIRNVTPPGQSIAEVYEKRTAEAKKIAAPNPEKKPAVGRTISRHASAATLTDISEMDSATGKKYFVAICEIPDDVGGEKNVEFFTFSESLYERLAGRKGDKIMIQYSQSLKGGFKLEDFDEIEGGDE